jgi:nucleotide-binding universal stress UspA family protein
MYKKILVALDMSDMAKEVFSQALSLAKQNQSELKLLHVISSEEDNSPLPVPPDLITFYPVVGNELTMETWQEQWETYINNGLDLLKQYTQEAIEAGITSDYTQLQGSPARLVCKFAKDQGVDLIIIGRRGRSGLSEILLGSVSNYVIHHAPCCVLVVQKGVVQSSQS